MIKWIETNINSYKTTNRIPYVFAVLIPFHIIGIVGLTYSIMYWEWIYLLYLAIGWIIFGGYGTAFMLHRYFSHNSVKIYSFLKLPLTWVSCMAGQGSPIWWASLHRGIHHAYSDTEKDLHSPIKGFWSAYMGWMFSIAHNTVSLKYAVDLLRDNNVVWFHKNYNKIIWSSIIALSFISAFINPMLIIWLYIIPALIDLHTDATVNSICHSKWAGYRGFETKDQSRNVPFLGWFGWGQGWHNNHHARPKSFDFGTSVSGKYLEFDPCLLLLLFVSPPGEIKRIWKERRDTCRGLQSLQL